MKRLFGKHGAFSKVMSMFIAMALIVSAVAFTPNLLAKFQSDDVYASEKQQQYELLDNVQDSAILHCWNWSYKTIEDNLELIAQCGYSAIQTSPATQPKDYAWEGVVGTDVGTPGVGGSGNWWKLYQPVAFNVCDNGQTWLGTKEELESLCNAADEYGIKVIVDVVANHMGNITGWKNSLSDVSPQVGQYFLADMLTDESYWHINTSQCWMSDSRYDFTQGTIGMPDLNTADKRVQKFVENYLKELIDCGVDGFRFDAAKHIETPDDAPDIASDFWPSVLNPAKEYYKNLTGKDLYVYGEILNTVGDNFSIDSYTKYMSVTDNSAGNHLLESFRNYNVNTLSMDYAPEVSVLWAESHDTFMNESSRYSSDKSIVRTWGMVANKDNASALFFVRPYYSYEFLENDVDGNFKGNLEATLTQAQMGACETYIWASKEVAAINHFNNRMVNENDEMGTEGNIAYCKRGNGIVIVNFNGSGNISMSAHGMPNGVYTDEVSRNTFVVNNGVLTGRIDSEYGIAVVYQNVMPNPSSEYPVQIKNSVGDGTTYYGNTLEVKINALYATEASYVASSGESGSFSGETVINIGNGLSKGDTLTLTITASNSKGSYTQTYTYYKDEYDLTDCIFFKNTNGWNGVTAYAWNDTVTPTVTNSSWPGEVMYECDTVNHIYALKIDTEAGYNKIIFSNSGSLKTDDLSIGQIGYMYDPGTGMWSKYQESHTSPVITATKDSTSFNGSISVTYKVSNADSAFITVNGVKESFANEITKVFTEDAVVKIEASNSSRSATKTYSYTRVYTIPSVSITASTEFADTMDVVINAVNASEAYYRINDGELIAFDGSVTIKIGADMQVNDVVTIRVTANNADGEAIPASATFKKIEKPVEDTVKIYVNVNKCSWFDNDNAVAAIRVDGESSYTAMEKTADSNGETIYCYEIPKSATTISIARMLPSGNCYNEKQITLENGKNYYISDNNWSNVTADVYDDTVITYKTPTITVDKQSGTYEGSVTVKITVKDSQSASYTLAGNTVSFTDTATVTISNTSTLSISAVNGDKTAQSSYSYTIVNIPVSDMVTIYFTNNHNWSNVYAYFWGGSSASGSWPGNNMTYVGLNEFNQQVYKIDIPADSNGLIFTNGLGEQTVDITSGINDKAGFYISGWNGSKLNVGTYTYVGN